MTTKKLLENLNNSNLATVFENNFKVIAKYNYNDSKSVFVLMSNKNGAPVYILSYRLDINYLTDITSIFCKTRATARELAIFESAVKEA